MTKHDWTKLHRWTKVKVCKFLRSLGWGVRLSNKAIVVTFKGKDAYGFFSKESALNFLINQIPI